MILDSLKREVEEFQGVNGAYEKRTGNVIGTGKMWTQEWCGGVKKCGTTLGS